MTVPVREWQLAWAWSEIQANQDSGLSLELLRSEFSFLFQLDCQTCRMYIIPRLLVTILLPQGEF